MFGLDFSTDGGILMGVFVMNRVTSPELIMPFEWD